MRPKRRQRRKPWRRSRRRRREWRLSVRHRRKQTSPRIRAGIWVCCSLLNQDRAGPAIRAQQVRMFTSGRDRSASPSDRRQPWLIQRPTRFIPFPTTRHPPRSSSHRRIVQVEGAAVEAVVVVRKERKPVPRWRSPLSTQSCMKMLSCRWIRRSRLRS